MLNTPISEGAVCGVAIGAAQAGLRPVVEIMFIDFITLALDQLVNQAAKAHFMSGGQLSVPMVLRTQGGAGSRSGAQHSQSLEAWLAHVPGLKVVMPSCAADAAGLLASAIADPGPVVFVENNALYFRREPAAPARRAGPDRARADRCARGSDLTIVATSRMVGEAIAAAEPARGRRDRGRGDRSAHAGAARHRHARRVGAPHRARRWSRTRRSRSAGSAPSWRRGSSRVAFDCLEAPIQRVGAPFAPVPVSPPLEDAYRPGADQILAAARRAIEWDWPESESLELPVVGAS